MSKPPSILFDFETVDVRPTAIVLDLAAVVFHEADVDTFTDLINSPKRMFRVKFDVRTQKGRTVDQSTLEWWAKQSDDAREVFNPSKIDVSIHDGITAFKEFCVNSGVNPKDSLAYVRGASFDFSILANIMRTVFGATEDIFPVAFWQQRDVRTAIAFAMLDPHLRKMPVPKGLFEGFVRHNSVHDCCKDVILLQHALAYGLGTIELPDDFDLM